MPTVASVVRLILSAVLLLSLAAPVAAEPPDKEPASTESGAPTPDATEPPPSQSDLDELRRRIAVLAEEVEALRSGEPEREPLTADQRRALGLSPSASSVYERKTGVSFAGYGEMVYEHFDATNQSGGGGPRASRIDFLRAIVYTGYRFSDKFIFNSEIEFEHGGEEVAVEFAYLDYRVRDDLSLRGGMVLVPLGLVNEFHEPTVFFGAKRPEVERRIIPSTWHENGFGVVGSRGPVSYRAYLVNGLDASGFSAAGIRGGRQGGAAALAADWAFAGRLDVTPVAGVFAGVGLYQGNSGQDQYAATDVGTTIVEVHGQGQMRGFDVRGLFVRASLDGVAALNSARGLTGAASIGEALQGGYLQVAYNVLSQQATRLAVSPFYRYEVLDTQREVPAGFLRDPANDVRYHTLGVELKPLNSIVVKADYQWISNDAGTGRNQFNVGLGYAF